MTVVVTGAAGLLGRHVARALAEAGHAVRGVDRVRAAGAGDDFVQADLTDFGAAVLALRGAQAVVHAAAIPRPVGRTSSDVFTTNVLAAYNVVEACVLHGVERLVNASSFSVLGLPFNPRPITPRYLPIDEAHPCAPQEAYALSKLVTETTVEAAVRRAGLTAISLRMPWIQTPETFGADVRPRRDDASVSARNLWSYIDARDAGEAFLLALGAPVSGHTPLYVSAADTFMEEPTEALVRATFDGVELRAPLAGHRTVLDTSAAERALGFRPRHSWRDYGAGPR